jgi:hypothetical protein
MGFMKRLLSLLLCLGCTGAIAADLTSGHTFVPGEANITDVTMNAIVGGAVINPTFITDKSSLAPSGADVFLYYSVANTAFRKTTLSTMFTANTALITGQAEDGSPAFNDFVLTYDTSAGTFKKVSLQNLPLANTNLFRLIPTTTTPALTDKIPLLTSSTNAMTLLSDLWTLFSTNQSYTVLFTNLTKHTGPTNTDQLLIWDSVAGINRAITYGSLVTNLPEILSPTNGAKGLYLLGSQSNNLGIVKASTLLTQTWLFPQHTVVSNSLASGTGVQISYGTIPGTLTFQVTLICTNATSADGYALNDELPIESLQDLGHTNVFQVYYSKPNSYIGVNQTANQIRVLQRGSGTLFTNLIQGNWNIRAVVTSMP